MLSAGTTSGVPTPVVTSGRRSWTGPIGAYAHGKPRGQGCHHAHSPVALTSLRSLAIKLSFYGKPCDTSIRSAKSSDVDVGV
jgi:hypothetical protein